jgi:hypothetical protein
MKRRWIWLPLISTAAACLTAEEAADPEAEDFAVAEAEISQGFVYTREEQVGVVALQVWTETYADWYTTCSGTLMTNRTVITAKHCVDKPDPYGRTRYVKMGSQRTAIVGQVLHPTYDVAIVKLQTGMLMPNWQYDRYATSPIRTNRTDYKRGTYQGTNQSIDGLTVACYGYGGASGSKGPQPPLTFAWMQATYNPNSGINPMDQMHTSRNGYNQLQEPGDSGGPCFNATGFVDSSPSTARLLSVLSGCFPSNPWNFCYSRTTPDISFWAWLAIASLES